MHITLHEIWRQFCAMSRTEIVAAVTGLVCIVLMVRNNIWTWIWGIVSVILYTIVFMRQNLFANAGLNFFYFLPISFYAWWVWLRCGPNKNDDLPVTRLTPRAIALWLLVTVLLCLVIVAAMNRGIPLLRLDPDPEAWADGVTTGLSIVAQYLQARKWIENWPLWIVADVIYTFYLFPKTGMYPSMILYGITTVLAFMGWAEWRRIMHTQHIGIKGVAPEA